ncbi:hypothetical protein ABH926_008136 [Catenulispora sp. GP43]|uniref:hypothetical protein n=1 Tax=Catenulispora sp. GP43 TaxID=3156263 RepID=UPI003517821B
MIVLAIVVGTVGLVVYEVRADRRVRRSTAGATPVVVVRGLRPRWWRLLLAKAIGFVVSVAFFVGVGLVAVHVLRGASTTSNPEHSWPMPGATSTPDLTPMHGASSTSTTSGKGR